MPALICSPKKVGVKKRKKERIGWPLTYKYISFAFTVYKSVWFILPCYVKCVVHGKKNFLLYLPAEQKKIIKTLENEMPYVLTMFSYVC